MGKSLFGKRGLMAITFTQQDLDNLKEALLTGAEEVQIGDRRIKYRSQQHLEKLIQMVEASLSNSATSSSSSKVIQAKFSKGQS